MRYFFSLFGSREEEVPWIVHQWWARPGSAGQRGQFSSVSTLHQQLWHWGGHQAKQRLRRDGFHGGERKVLHLCCQSRLLTHLWHRHEQQSSDWWRWVAGGRWGSNNFSHNQYLKIYTTTFIINISLNSSANWFTFHLLGLNTCAVVLQHYKMSRSSIWHGLLTDRHCWDALHM